MQNNNQVKSLFKLLVGLMINQKGIEMGVAARLKGMDYAVFDFDGTIYPKLLLFDVTKKVFEFHKEERYKEKLENLINILNIFKVGNFVEAQNEYLKLIHGEDREEFIKTAKELISGCFPFAQPAIRKLREGYKLKCYMISLTPDFIAGVIAEIFGFEKVFSVGYLHEKGENGDRFTGKIAGTVEAPHEIKSKMLSELQKYVGTGKKFICFFDSVDDLPIANAAALRIMVNPRVDLSKEIDVDWVLNDKIDPWKKFYEVI